MSRMHRPENAQKRAKEFLDVGKAGKALDTLYDVIRRNKMRNNASESVLEPIMLMYLRLCVDQRKSHLAKEGLYQYRNVFQTSNVMTLDKVVRKYLDMAEERTEQARKESSDAVSKVDDLDNIATPEEMLLTAVSGEGAQDRSDRTILTPWVKFLWESYRQCLELLRNNSLVEKLYHEIAKKAFSFCERFQRKTEFRKLCDNLFNHLQHIQKPSTSARAVSLSNPETQLMNLETRLEQLNYAISMESWQEAYRAIEYVSDLMTKSKKSPKPQIMSSYYSKLSLVFWKADNQLFHAAALLKLFQLNKEQKKNITPEEVSKRAAIVLVATMSIPLPSSRPEFDRFIETEKSAMDKVSRLATLLSLPKAPTRASLFRELVRCGVLSAVPRELLDTYNILEVQFDPLKLCPSIKTHLEWIKSQVELQQYTPALETMAVTRLVKELAQIYSTITFPRLLEHCCFMDKFKLERVLVDLVRHNDQQIRIDHRNNCINFGSALSECQREDLPEGPTLQSMPSENIRNQLVNMYSTINKCVQLIVPDSKKKETESSRTQSMAAYNQTKLKEHSKILMRQQTIELRKERLENQTLEREESIRRAQEELQQKQKLEEQERLKREASEREKQRQEEQRKQIQTKQIKDKLQQISGTTYGQKMIEKFNENSLIHLDAEVILQVQVEELEKERKELLQRLKGQEKKIDYMERAKRLAEIPKYIELNKDQKKKDMEFWNNEQEKKIKNAKLHHTQSLEMSKRFNHMRKDLGIFLDQLTAACRSETQKKMDDFKAILEVERKKRLLERKEQRKRDRREAFLKEKAEEQQRLADEQLKKEKELKEAEELQRQKKEEEYLRRKEEMDRQDKLRRMREMEVEKKIKDREGTGSATIGSQWRGAREETEDSREVWRPSGNSTWRNKEEEKLDTWRKKEEAAPQTEPPKRSAMVSKDIRLEEDFKEEQRNRDENRPPKGEDRFQSRDGDRYQPRRGDDRGGNRDGGRWGDDRGGRFGGEDRRGGGRFGDDRRGGDGGRFGDDRRGGDGGRFGDDRRGGNSGRFGDDRRGGDGGRFGDDRRGGDGGRFGDDRRGGDGGRFGDDRRGGGGRFGGDDRGGNRDGGRWGDDRRGGGRFGDDRRGGGGRFAEDNRRDGGGRFGGDGDRFGGRSHYGNEDRRGDGDFNRGGGDGEWRRGGGKRDVERRPPAREEESGGSNWRRDGPLPKRDEERRGQERGGGRGGRNDPPPRREKPNQTPDADGWTKIRK